MINLDDLDAVARTVWGEARGESWYGQLAVAWVIRNRVEHPTVHWWGRTFRDVCRKPQQFSCWNEDDPNFMPLSNATLEQESFVRAWGIACCVITGIPGDPTYGATHYHARGVKPPWARGIQPCFEIGGHVFYKGVA